jgi:hypothetical protein
VGVSRAARQLGQKIMDGGGHVRVFGRTPAGCKGAPGPRIGMVS